VTARENLTVGPVFGQKTGHSGAVKSVENPTAKEDAPRVGKKQPLAAKSPLKSRPSQPTRDLTPRTKRELDRTYLEIGGLAVGSGIKLAGLSVDHRGQKRLKATNLGATGAGRIFLT